MIDQSQLDDLLLWEEGVCLTCGEVSGPLDDLTRLHECEACGAKQVYPAGMLLRVKEVMGDDSPF